MVVVLLGMVRVNVPAVIVWLPNVCTLTALFDCEELYSNTASNAVPKVTLVYVIEAEGVTNATPAVAEELVPVGAVPIVTFTPPAV